MSDRAEQTVRPEVPTDRAWRDQMKRARKRLDLTQGQLGGRVGVSQNVISDIESGKILASAFIMPICRVLDIDPPILFESDEDRRWLELGRDLRRRNPDVYKQAVKMVESLLAALERPTK